MLIKMVWDMPLGAYYRTTNLINQADFLQYSIQENNKK